MKLPLLQRTKYEQACAIILTHEGQWLPVAALAKAAGCQSGYLTRMLQSDGPAGLSLSLHSVEWRGRHLPAWYALCHDCAAFAEWYKARFA